MECPKCLKYYVCGCKSCESSRTSSEFKSSILSTGKEDYIQCPYCKTKFHPDQLLDYEWIMMTEVERITGDRNGEVSEEQLNEIRKTARNSRLLKHMFKDE